MTVTADAKRDEVDSNFEVFLTKIDEILPLHMNSFALMRNKEIVEYYSTFDDAFKTGTRFFSDGLFSIQHVTKSPVDLGYFSHAVHLG